MANETGVLTVSSGLPNCQRTVDTVFSACTFEIECYGFDYHAAINGNLEKFDQHLNSFLASSIESKVIANIKRSHKKQCPQCIEVFHENELIHDDFIARRSSLKTLCLSTVHIIQASNEIFSILKQLKIHDSSVNVHDSTLKTIMSHLHTEELYQQSNFESHGQSHSQWTHKEKFIYEIVLEYMRQKSCKIGIRITEEEKGNYIRHNNKKLVHISGQ